MPVVIITGAARGIGAATAQSMAKSGWKVALVDGGDQLGPSAASPKSSSTGELVSVTEVCASYSPAIALIADVRSAASVRRAVETAAAELGSIDAAVAAAGRIHGSLAWDTPDEAWRELLDVNLHGVRHLAEAVVPGYISRGGSGRFVAVASAAASHGLEQLAAYSASKSAVLGYVRSLAADLKDSVVTANVVSPGSTDTEMLSAAAAIYGLEGPHSFGEHQFLGRILAPGEIAAAIEFLCGPGASGLTGAVIPVDGGMTA